MIPDYHRASWSGRRRTQGEKFPRLLRLLRFFGVLLVVSGTILGMREGYLRVIRLPYFKIAEVQVEGNLQVSHDEIVAGLGIEPDASILEINLEALTHRVLKNPWIKEASIRRRLPLTLTVAVVERMPEAIFVADRRYLLSADGVILAELGEDELPGLPVLRSVAGRRVAVGEQILTSEMVQGLAVWRQFQLANALAGERAREIAMAGDGTYTVNLGEGMPQIRLRAQDLEGQMRRLGLALAAGHLRLAQFRDVDLRFRDRVVFTPVRG
jgi:cell division septal protein FtsQ